MDFTQRMTEIMTFIKASLTAGATHSEVCRMTADQFALWEDDHFPLWLSFIVAGQMREMGIEN